MGEIWSANVQPTVHTLIDNKCKPRTAREIIVLRLLFRDSLSVNTAEQFTRVQGKLYAALKIAVHDYYKLVVIRISLKFGIMDTCLQLTK